MWVAKKVGALQKLGQDEWLISFSSESEFTEDQESQLT
jgi:hypothetical protein